MANTKQESQNRVWQKERKKSRKRKVSTSGEDSESSSTDSSSPATKKKKTKRWWHDQTTRHLLQLQLPAFQVPMRNRIMIGLKESLKIKIFRNYPKVWLTMQTNILKNTLQRIVWKRLYYSKRPTQIILIMSRS